MATIAPVATYIGDSTPPCVAITWSPLNSSGSDVCTPAFVGHLQDKSVQLFGTVTSIAIHGTCGASDGTYAALSDPQGNALSAINAPKIEAILEHCSYIKPVITTSTDATVIIFGRLHYTEETPTMAPTPKAEPTPAPPTIPLTDAHSLIEQMENRLRPFLRVKEVLAAAIGAEELLARMARTQAQLQTEIDATAARRDAESAQAAQAQAEHAEAAAKAQAVASASLDATRAVLAKAQSDLEGLRAAHRKATLEQDELRVARTREVEALDARIADLKAELGKLVSRYRVE